MPPDPIEWLVKHTKERLDDAIKELERAKSRSVTSQDFYRGYVCACERAYSDALEVQKNSYGRGWLSHDS